MALRLSCQDTRFLLSSSPLSEFEDHGVHRIVLKLWGVNEVSLEDALIARDDLVGDFAAHAQGEG